MGEYAVTVLEERCKMLEQGIVQLQKTIEEKDAEIAELTKKKGDKE